MPDRYEFEVGMNSGPLKQSLGDIGKMREAVGGLAATFGGPLVGQVGAAIGAIRAFGIAMMANPVIAVIAGIAAAAKLMAWAIESHSEKAWHAFSKLQAKATELRKEAIALREEYQKLAKTGRFAETPTEKAVIAGQKAAKQNDIAAIDSLIADQREAQRLQGYRVGTMKGVRDTSAKHLQEGKGDELAFLGAQYESDNKAFEAARLELEKMKQGERDLVALRQEVVDRLEEERKKRDETAAEELAALRKQNDEAEAALELARQTTAQRLASLKAKRDEAQATMLGADTSPRAYEDARKTALDLDKQIAEAMKEQARLDDEAKKKADDKRKARAEELQHQRQLLELRLQELRAGGVDAGEKGAEAAAAKRKKAVEAELATLAKGMPDLMRQLQTEAATKRAAAATTAADKTKALNEEVAKMSVRSVRSIDWGEAFDIARGQSGETDPAQETAAATKRLVELNEDIRKALAGGVK